MDDLFFQVHESLPRQGPGDAASTRRALTLLPDLSDDMRILDLMCGPGAQTLDLARVTRGPITAVDIHEPFLDLLDARLRVEGMENRVRLLNADPGALDLPPESFDLIWSEGAARRPGFAEALGAWKRFLKPGGCLAATGLTWLAPDPPEEARRFWGQAYPAMTGIEENLATIRSLGGEPLGHFTLPESAWWDTYYTPLEMRLSAFAQRHRDDEKALASIQSELAEIELYRKYPDAYGYVFYVARFG